MLTKEEYEELGNVIADLEALRRDCEVGFEKSTNWDEHSWEALEDIAICAINFLEKLEDKYKPLTAITYENVEFYQANPDAVQEWLKRLGATKENEGI